MHVTGPGVSLSNQLTGPANLTGPGTSAGSSNASSGRGSFKLKNVPIVDVQVRIISMYVLMGRKDYARRRKSPRRIFVS